MTEPDGRGCLPTAAPARPAHHRARPKALDSGAVTAEFALLLPVLIVLLTALLAGATAGAAQLQCIDAARAGARAAARHDDPRRLAMAAAPGGAAVRVSGAGELVTVRVSAQVQLPLPWRPRIEVQSESTAQVEPEVNR